MIRIDRDGYRTLVDNLMTWRLWSECGFPLPPLFHSLLLFLVDADYNEFSADRQLKIKINRLRVTRKRPKVFLSKFAHYLRYIACCLHSSIPQFPPPYPKSPYYFLLFLEV